MSCAAPVPRPPQPTRPAFSGGPEGTAAAAGATLETVLAAAAAATEVWRNPLLVSFRRIIPPIVRSPFGCLILSPIACPRSSDKMDRFHLDQEYHDSSRVGDGPHRTCLTAKACRRKDPQKTKPNNRKGSIVNPAINYWIREELAMKKGFVLGLGCLGLILVGLIAVG